MGGIRRYLRAVGKAVLANGLEELSKGIPFGPVLYKVGVAVLHEWRQGPAAEPIREPIAALVVAAPEEVHREAREVVLELAADQPAEVQDRLAGVLELLPYQARRTLARPDDRTGRTIPADWPLDRPEQLVPFLPPAAPLFAAGQTVPGRSEWVLEGRAGVGGFAEVWKARHAGMGDAAAVKFFTDPAARERLLRHEAAVLRQVRASGRHPNVVELRDVVLTADPPCLMFEYVDGGDLAKYVAGQTWEAAERAAWATEVVRELAAAVGHFHRLDPCVVHRDLKPQNVPLDRLPGGRVVPRIADFGIGGVVAARRTGRLAGRCTRRPGRTG
ncbi:MAG: protein kinase [Gemmataceae bacterium]|nr:protein kinase [Gemmataceae bacterium]